MTGNIDQARALLNEGDRMARNHHHSGALGIISALEGSLALMLADPDEAEFRFDRAKRATATSNPAFLRIAADHTEALYRSGRADEARASVREFDAATSEHPTLWSQIALARARVVVADDDRVTSVIDDALAISYRADSPYEIARLSFSCAMTFGRVGRTVQSREQRREAENLFERNSAPGWAEAARAIEPTPDPETLHPLLATLTDNELAVLRLIRRGARNKDIAASLFVSLRTVEMRITQIYRKLDAHSRSHLLALLPVEVPTKSGDPR
jgi:DNA-binding NarL/FixJ family response regulator